MRYFARSFGERIMTRATFRTAGAALLLFLCAGSLSSAALAQSDQRKLVSAATRTLSAFLTDHDMSWLKSNLPRAKALLIAPSVTKAGFIVGGSGGRAVVLARDPKTGKWSGPAFYVLATASLGFQAGVSVSETVTLVMTDTGLASLLSRSFKMGADASVAAGPVGTGAQSNLVADFIAFSRAKGIYGGLSLDGTVASISGSWNHAYYGREVSATDILVRQTVRQKQASELINVATVASKTP
jgi:SH3 domain-containing YSC84-like protein 1